MTALLPYDEAWLPAAGRVQQHPRPLELHCEERVQGQAHEVDVVLDDLTLNGSIRPRDHERRVSEQLISVASVVLRAHADFQVVQTTCASSLPAGDTCTVSVVFMPTAAGARTGRLIIIDNAPINLSIVALSGSSG